MTTSQAPSLDTATIRIIGSEERHVAHNYHPLPVVIARGEGRG